MIYIRQIKERIDESHQALVLAEEIKEVKNQALKAQIKPHFIFNTMTSIQDIYHRSLEEGDRALSRFSKHLRLNVDSGYKDMVSFQDELNNIQNYFELENLRRGGKLSLLYDIDYVDFDIPILSLQPLIENAVKYGKTDEKEDGYIQIKSYEEEESIIVEVNDNGSGFDISEIKENSTGLKNVTQRLGFSLNANVEIISKKGEGTTVKIIIPKVSK
jgi:LytS/YehU family sensor histidine kinase